MNLLVVDDEPSLLRLLEHHLTRQGHSVSTAASVAAAQCVLANQYDVAVIDWTLPDGNGLEIGRELLDRHPAIRVVFASGYPLDATIVPAELRPRIRFLQKPFLPRALADLLASL